MTGTKLTANVTPSANPDTVHACFWCGKPLRSRRSGSAERFCCAAHRNSYWTACRKLGEVVVSSGIVNIADLKADPAACTLPELTKSPPTVPAAGIPSNAAPDAATVRLVVEVPQARVQRLVFRDYVLCPHQRDDPLALLAALVRLGLRPTITVTEDAKLLSY